MVHLYLHTWVKYFPDGFNTFMDKSRMYLMKSHWEPNTTKETGLMIPYSPYHCIMIPCHILHVSIKLASHTIFFKFWSQFHLSSAHNNRVLVCTMVILHTEFKGNHNITVGENCAPGDLKKFLNPSPPQKKRLHLLTEVDPHTKYKFAFWVICFVYKLRCHTGQYHKRHKTFQTISQLLNRSTHN